MFPNSSAPGMVLVVMHGDATLFQFYGEREKGNKHPPDGASLLWVNSITKVLMTELSSASPAMRRCLPLASIRSP